MTYHSWVFTVPGWRPTSENRWDGHHWSVRRSSKSLDLGVLRSALVNTKNPPPKIDPVRPERRVVYLGVLLDGSQQACDPSNYWKSLLDCLVVLGLIHDDDFKFSDHRFMWHRRTVYGSKGGTVIRIMETPPRNIELTAKSLDELQEEVANYCIAREVW